MSKPSVLSDRQGQSVNTVTRTLSPAEWARGHGVPDFPMRGDSPFDSRCDVEGFPRLTIILRSR